MMALKKFPYCIKPLNSYKEESTVINLNSNKTKDHHNMGKLKIIERSTQEE